MAQRINPTMRPVNTTIEQPGLVSRIGNSLLDNLLIKPVSYAWRHPFIAVGTVGVTSFAYYYFIVKNRKAEAPVETAAKIQESITKAGEELKKAQERHAALTNNTNGLIDAARAKTQNTPAQRTELEEKIKKNKDAISKLEEQMAADPTNATSIAGACTKARTELEANEKALKELDTKALNAEVRKLRQEELDLEVNIEKLQESITALTEKHKQTVKAEQEAAAKKTK